MANRFHVIFLHPFGEEPGLMPTPTQAHVEWCRRMWSVMADGGSWGLPASGLIFQKREAARELVLIDAMPHTPEMPITADELLARQISLYIDTVEHFALCDVKVRRECSWPVPAKG
jgi:hypothetical protein